MKIGEYERAILRAIYDLGEAGLPAYGLDVRQLLEQRGFVKWGGIGWFYYRMARLADDCYVVKTDEPGGPGRSGLPRARYDLTGHGLAEVERKEQKNDG